MCDGPNAAKPLDQGDGAQYKTQVNPELAITEPVGRREELKAQNRAKLLAAARKVFAEKGFGAATTRDIVRETDLASGTFYNYFEDKNEIFRALIAELGEKMRVAARAQRRRPGSVEERLENAYRAYFELVIEERELFEVVRRNAGLIDSEVFEASIRELFVDLAHWTESGELPPLDLDYVATAMVGIAFQVATHLIDRQPPDIDAAARFCTRLCFGGIRGLAE
jgi:AcrR family transcriptional regulator